MLQKLAKVTVTQQHEQVSI